MEIPEAVGRVSAFTLIGNVIIFLLLVIWFYQEPSWHPLIWLIASGLGLVAQLGVVLRNWVATWALRIGTIFGLRGRVFNSEPVPPGDLETLYREFVRMFGEDIAGLPQLRAIQLKNKYSVYRVGEYDALDAKKEPHYVGFFEVFAITKRAALGVVSGKADGRTLTATHICTPRYSGADCYIAGVGVLPGRENAVAKAAVLRELHVRISQLNSSRSLRLYARPVTPDGLRLVKRYKFVKIREADDDLNTVWLRDVKRGELTHEAAVAGGTV